MKWFSIASLFFLSFSVLAMKNPRLAPLESRNAESDTAASSHRPNEETLPPESHLEIVIGTITEDDLEAWSNQQALKTKRVSLAVRIARITDEILPEIDRIERARKAQLSHRHGELVRLLTAIQRVRDRWLDELESTRLESLRLEEIEMSLTRENQ
jgi:hypothetical protein